MTRRVVVNDNKALGGALIKDELADSDVDVDVDVEAVCVDTLSSLIDVLEDAEALVAAVGVPITADVFAAADSISAVGRAGIGCDNVDLGAARDHGVTVMNVPTYAIEEVSTHALAQLLSCVRSLPQYDHDLKTGGWDWRVGRPIERVRGQTLGFVAFGNIARRFVEKVRPFDLEVVAYDPYVDREEMAAYGVEKTSFEDLCERSTLLSVHAPLSEETEGLFDRAAFERLPNCAILVNTGRGPVVDLDALADALEAGDLAMAGLDVFAMEPLPTDSPLRGRDDVVLTPHAAWYSETSQREVYRMLARDIVRVFEGDEPEGKLDPDEIPWR